MAVFEDKLVLNAHGDLLLFDGASWDRLGLSPNALVVLDYAVDRDAMIMGSSLGLCLLTPDGFRFFSEAGMYQVRSVTRFGPWWAMPYLHIPAGHLSHGPAGTRYAEVTEEGDWHPFHSGVWLLRGDVMRRAAVGVPDLWKLEDAHAVIRSQEMIVSAHAFEGRLFFGTHPEGRVLVLPVAKEGALESTPRAVSQQGHYLLSWEAATPPGTSCRFQIRTAPTRETLDGAPFVGLDGDASSFFEEPGTEFAVAEPGFLQYRVVLETEDPAITPHLKRVTIGRSD
jgi:hypothetical protein